MRLFNPWKLYGGIQDLRSIVAGGGPRLVRLVRVGEPEGIIVPTAEVAIEIEARDGTRVCLTPEVPVPFPWAWAIRIARRLGVPLISSVEPESFRFQVSVPGTG